MFNHIKAAATRQLRQPALTRASFASPQFRMVHQVTSASEFKQVTASGPVIVDFYATWCGPCKAIAPLIEKLEPEYADVKFAKIDIEEVSEVASEYQIQAIPTFLFFKDGKVVGTVKGADPGRVKQGLQAISS